MELVRTHVGGDMTASSSPLALDPREGERTVNPDLSNPAKFQVNVPAGLATLRPKQ